MTIYTIYPNANDHMVESFSSDLAPFTYAQVRAGTANISDSAAGTAHTVGQSYNPTNYSAQQYFMSFDTSAVMVGVTLAVSLTVKLLVAPSYNKQIDVAERAWSGGTGDWVPGANLSALTAAGNRTFTTADTGAVAITGMIDPARSATYKLMMFAHELLTNTAPVNNNETIIFYSVDRVGTTDDPFLTIDVVPGGPVGMAEVTTTALALNVGLPVPVGMAEVTTTALALAPVLALPVGMAEVIATALPLILGLIPPAERTSFFPASSFTNRIADFT